MGNGANEPGIGHRLSNFRSRFLQQGEQFHFFVTNGRHFLQSAREILLQLVPHRVQLESDGQTERVAAKSARPERESGESQRRLPQKLPSAFSVHAVTSRGMNICSQGWYQTPSDIRSRLCYNRRKGRDTPS